MQNSVCALVRRKCKSTDFLEEKKIILLAVIDYYWRFRIKRSLDNLRPSKDSLALLQAEN